MPIVRNSVPETDGRLLVNIYVVDVDGIPCEAYDGATGLSLPSHYQIRSADNSWEADLPVNGLMLPVDTSYKVVETWQPGNKNSNHRIQVPLGAGPFELGQILYPLEDSPELEFMTWGVVNYVPLSWQDLASRSWSELYASYS